MNKIKLGKYQHYKGKFYELIHTGWHSDTMENYVVYKALYDCDDLGEKPVFVKNEEEFCKTINIFGNEVPRFEFIETEFSEERMMSLIKFQKESEKLKHVERAIPLSGLQRYENTAEHSWHMALFLMTLNDQFSDTDSVKMMKMCIIHDLVEVYTGDVPTFDEKGRIGKPEREQEAAKKLFSQLPEDLHHEFKELFDEFEKQETREAKIVRSCDQVQAILQNIIAEGKAFIGNNLGIDWIDNYAKQLNHDPVFVKIYEMLRKEIKANGLAWEK